MLRLEATSLRVLVRRRPVELSFSLTTQQLQLWMNDDRLKSRRSPFAPRIHHGRGGRVVSSTRDPIAPAVAMLNTWPSHTLFSSLSLALLILFRLEIGRDGRTAVYGEVTDRRGQHGRIEYFAFPHVVHLRSGGKGK
eukprot:scaffold4663_cov104-Isochrysis_galbana.AAC.14